MKNVSELQNKLNNIKFEGMESIKCGDVLHYPLIRLESIIDKNKPSAVELVKLLLKTIQMLLTTSYSSECVGNANKCFLYSSAYGNRADLFSNFRSVANLFDDSIVMYFSGSSKINLKNLKFINFWFKWNQQLSFLDINLLTRIYLLKNLLQMYMEFELCNKEIIDKNISCFVSFCDVHPTESLFTQFFNNRNVLTMTLQHGVYSSLVNDWVFLGSKSDYLLGYGRFTVDEGKRMGLEDGKIATIGAMSMIGKIEREKPTKYNTEKIGLILDGEDGYGERDLNKNMIRFIQNYCRNYNKELYVKFHPASNIDDYSDVLNSRRNVYAREVSLTEFCEMIDIAIMCNSTCLIETLQMWIPSFLYSEENQCRDVYSTISSCKFDTEEKLNYYITNVNTVKVCNVMDNIRSYLCENGDPSDRFRDFINRKTGTR